jgi:rare lipoprotein A
MTSPVLLPHGHSLGRDRLSHAKAALAFALTVGALVGLVLPATAEPMTKGGGHHKIGSAYEIKGKVYTPTDTDDLVETGIASWYGPDFHGKKTANGEIYDMTALTAAHKTMPLPSYAYVTNLQNGRKILVRVNDRGPFVGDRLIDLSHGVAQLLGYFDRGLTEVRVEYAGPAPLNGDDRHERQVLAEQSWYSNPSTPSLKPVAPPTVLASTATYQTTATNAPISVERGIKPVVKSEPVVRIPAAAVAAVATVQPKPKPVKLARATSSQGATDDGLGYRRYDHCWSCGAY